MFLWVSVVAFMFGSSQLQEGSLKLMFVCRYVDGKSKNGCCFFLNFWSNYGKGKGIKVTEPNF